MTKGDNYVLKHSVIYKRIIKRTGGKAAAVVPLADPV